MSKFFLDDSAPGAYVLYQTDTGRRRGRRTMELRLTVNQANNIVGLLGASTGMLLDEEEPLEDVVDEPPKKETKKKPKEAKKD